MTSLRYTAFTDVGPNRKNNQDSGYASPRLLILADGMGGQAAGDLASAVAVQTVRRLDGPLSGDVLEALAGAIHRANDRLSELVEEDAELEGMGTTLIAMVFHDGSDDPADDDGQQRGRSGPRVDVAHVGDSRAYLLRDGELQQLTADHTFVQSLVDEGRITADQARTHPHRSLILKALQGGHSVDPDLSTIDLRPGDRLLLCSDGLSDYVDPDVIAATLGGGSIEEAAVELVRLALDARTTDNVTCVIGEVVEDEGTETGPLVVGSATEQPRPPTRHAGTGTGTALADDDDRVDGDRVDGDRDAEELRYAPRSYRRGRWLVNLVLAVVVVGLVGSGLMWAYDWSQGRFYVTESDGSVAIFRGIQQDVPGITLSELHEDTALSIDDLPEYSQEEVRDGIAVDDLAAAHDKVRQLQELAADCRSGGRASAECSEDGLEPTATTPPPPPDEPTRPGDGTDGGGGGAGTGGGGGGTDGGGGTGGGGGSGGSGGGGAR